MAAAAALSVLGYTFASTNDPWVQAQLAEVVIDETRSNRARNVAYSYIALVRSPWDEPPELDFDKLGEDERRELNGQDAVLEEFDNELRTNLIQHGSRFDKPTQFEFAAEIPESPNWRRIIIFLVWVVGALLAYSLTN